MTKERTVDRLVKVELAIDAIEPEELGKTLKEYIGESNHQGIPWEGFNSRDMTGIVRFLEDFALYLNTSLGQETAT